MSDSCRVKHREPNALFCGLATFRLAAVAKSSKLVDVVATWSCIVEILAVSQKIVLRKKSIQTAAATVVEEVSFTCVMSVLHDTNSPE